MIRCLVVDDEPLAQIVLENYIDRTPDFELVERCANALEAFEVISTTDIDLMFLDIKMPVMSGLEFIKILKSPPQVIFTTAFSEYAIEGYELAAVDYLLKPITYERFLKSVGQFLKLNPAAEIRKDYSYFKVNGRLLKIEHKSIIYVRSIKDYVIIHTTEGNHITHMTMKYLTEMLPADLFRRVHRSFLIGIRFVTALGNNEVLLGETSISIGDSFKKEARSLQHALYNGKC